MKKIKFTGKLSLNKETVSKLNDEEMNSVNGGNSYSCNGPCATVQGCGTTTTINTVRCPTTDCNTSPGETC